MKNQSTPRKLLLPALLLLLLLFTLARAIQTPEVEIGNNGAYDGSVKIRRDTQGRMLFSDSEVTNPVTLNDLRYSGVDHGLMLGLADDDHAQYHTAARHAAAHIAAFNGALATPADVHANVTLGAHLLDAVIHPLPGVYEPAFAAGTTAQYRRGDKTWQTLNQAAVAGLTAADSPTFANLAVAAGGRISTPGDLLIQADNDNNGSNLINFINGTGGSAAYITEGGSGWFSSAVVCNLFGSYNDLVLRPDSDDNGANALIVQNGTGTELVRVNETGNMGVGDATPAALFTVGNGDLFQIDASGFVTAPKVTVDNLRLDGNTISSLDTNGSIALAPNGAGQVTVAGDLAVGSGAGKILLNGQRLGPAKNLLDNPDFNIWQRNISQTCAAGGNAGGTITWPVPGTLGTGADRWQISRSKTDMSTTVSRAAPPASLPTAAYCLKNEYAAGADCFQYIHQTVPREVTAGLRGKWVTFAVSHYLNGAGGGNVAIYKFVGSTPSALINYAFTATASAWDRLAVAAQVPTDADFICVSVKSNLNSAGPTVAYIANAALVEGKYVGTTEKVTDPAASSLPPLPHPPADDLARCQHYYEKGVFSFSAYAGDTDTHNHFVMVHFNTAKDGDPALTLSNINDGGLSGLEVTAEAFPAYSAGQTWPQGFRVTLNGSASGAGPLDFYGDWIAACPEPN